MNITHFDSKFNKRLAFSALFTVLCQAFTEVFLFQDVYQDFAASILQVCDTPYDPRCVCMCSDVNRSTVHLSLSLSVHLSASLSLEKHQFLHPFQSGFRHKYSCNTALAHLTNSWLTVINKSDISGVVFLDLKKAFEIK